MVKRAYFAMAFEFYLECEETETEITYIEAVEIVVVDGVRTEVPGVSSISTELQTEYCLVFGDFLMSEQLCVVHTVVWVVIGMHGS
jgi:hypothetical protein